MNDVPTHRLRDVACISWYNTTQKACCTWIAITTTACESWWAVAHAACKAWHELLQLACSLWRQWAAVSCCELETCRIASEACQIWATTVKQECAAWCQLARSMSGSLGQLAESSCRRDFTTMTPKNVLLANYPFWQNVLLTKLGIHYTHVLKSPLYRNWCDWGLEACMCWVEDSSSEVSYWKKLLDYTYTICSITIKKKCI